VDSVGQLLDQHGELSSDEQQASEEQSALDPRSEQKRRKVNQIVRLKT
jgi:hypothetical protein